MANFLDVDDSLLARTLLLNNNGSGISQEELSNDTLFPSRSQIVTPSERLEQSQCKFIIPHAGICIKTREVITSQKVFINLCQSDDVPEPDQYFTDEEMRSILSNGSDEDVKDIRLPMSLGDKHIETDKSGSQCPVFDVVINKIFFEQKILKSEMYRTFLIVVTMEGLEEKFSLELDKDGYVILAHKKSFGKLNPHFVKNRPGIKELKVSNVVELKSSTLSPASSKKTLVEEIDTKELQLDCNITQVSSELAKAEIKLPNLKNTRKLVVTLGADRIIVDSPVGSLDVFVPVDIHQEESKAEFNITTKVLSLHLPLVTKP